MWIYLQLHQAIKNYSMPFMRHVRDRIYRNVSAGDPTTDWWANQPVTPMWAAEMQKKVDTLNSTATVGVWYLGDIQGNPLTNQPK